MGAYICSKVIVGFVRRCCTEFSASFLLDDETCFVDTDLRFAWVRCKNAYILKTSRGRKALPWMGYLVSCTVERLTSSGGRLVAGTRAWVVATLTTGKDRDVVEMV